MEHQASFSLNQIAERCNDLYARYGIKPNVLMVDKKTKYGLSLLSINIGGYNLAVIQKPSAIENDVLVGYVVPVDESEA